MKLCAVGSFAIVLCDLWYSKLHHHTVHCKETKSKIKSIFMFRPIAILSICCTSSAVRHTNTSQRKMLSFFIRNSFWNNKYFFLCVSHSLEIDFIEMSTICTCRSSVFFFLLLLPVSTFVLLMGPPIHLIKPNSKFDAHWWRCIDRWENFECSLFVFFYFIHRRHTNKKKFAQHNRLWQPQRDRSNHWNTSICLNIDCTFGEKLLNSILVTFFLFRFVLICCRCVEGNGGLTQKKIHTHTGHLYAQIQCLYSRPTRHHQAIFTKEWREAILNELKRECER